MRQIYRALFKQLMQSAARSHRSAGRPPLAGYAFDHITLKLHIDGRFAYRELDALEHQLFPKLDRDSICLDIGANIGNHAVNFADHFSHVHAFEPNRKALDLLQINARLRPNITVHPVGLSDHSHTLTAIQPEGNLGGTGASATGHPADQRVDLPLVALDGIDLGLNGRAVSFVKIDVEGLEAEVIRGASKTLATHRPVIGMEVDRRSVTGGTSPALAAAGALGYRHMYAMRRARRTRFRAISNAVGRNHSMLLLSMDPLDLS
ncbi:FkbM family methyltransferase [Sulfitobacter sp. M57]|uniref:FkbM family methyltransferase n=1 Tax=unclassified Sulfitobacter TaxID=196795 RepID=UPI0023E13EE6|nr:MULTISPECIES: FkbM family methyltransferase [unclassified Sulfitobacter]MDF3415368.1 FkbM family methyltransferase [Sulfitobacter sp. KE5]MDF3422849.1 FkbM family methyltransferase [Sulfitobacter sp. KE43]MDF3433914.1 FkbM family methyltransferase [Sulfitobacter sp. KE42]MDF3459554.1 FkbM family methyltransferase [Sulfitobacter sp. S74]MDF3463453.1 FkbM family methyltransferase [Sulfitobacter sp. Ks18]